MKINRKTYKDSVKPGIKVLNIIVVAIVLLVHFFNLAFTTVYFQYELISAKEDATEYFEEGGTELLTEITLHKNDVKKEIEFKGKNEFVYLGRMYDIKSRRIENDSITFTVYRDTKEEKVIEQITDSSSYNQNEFLAKGHHPKKVPQKRVHLQLFAQEISYCKAFLRIEALPVDSVYIFSSLKHSPSSPPPRV